MLLFALIAAISLPPKPDHYVTDRAGVIANSAALNAKLADFERQTSDQILVYVDQHLPPDTNIQEMGSEAMKQWGVGQKGKDNGAILFIFTADRKMRIEVGYGLEGALTDAKSKHIIETVIKPQFQRGDYSAGIDQGVSAILAHDPRRAVHRYRVHGREEWGADRMDDRRHRTLVDCGLCHNDCSGRQTRCSPDRDDVRRVRLESGR